MKMLEQARAFMAEASPAIDGWLVYDFRGSNAVLGQLLPARPGAKRWTTRRIFLLVPAKGEMRLLVHGLDAAQFDPLPGGVKREVYVGRVELEAWLKAALEGCKRVAMEYVPGGALPVMSMVDGGTLEMVRGIGGMGIEVVSSADLVQATAARWSDEAIKGHERASALVARIKDEAFAFIGKALREGRPVHEHEAQRFILDRFAQEGLETNDEPIVAVNEHSGDPHYGPSAERPTPIRRGDWVMIDLWARLPGEENIFSDITWMGYAGKDAGERVPAEQQRVFDVVKAARDAALAAAQGAWKAGREVQGWELDEAARAVIIAAGHGQHIRHRTGHSLSPGPLVHGLGMNLDNLETRDTRRMLPGIGFTIEPGVYTPQFGARLEINVRVDEATGPVVTSCVQEDIVKFG